MAKTKLSKKELGWYITAGVFATAGVTLMIFGIISSHLPVMASKNVFKDFDAQIAKFLNLGLDSRMLGLILFLIAAVITVSTLAYFARASEKVIDKTARRSSKHGAINLGVLEAKSKAVEVIEEPKVEAPKTEETPKAE